MRNGAPFVQGSEACAAERTSALGGCGVSVWATHLEATLSSRESVHDEDHAHHGERSSRQSPHETFLQSRVQDPGHAGVPSKRCIRGRRGPLSHGINANIVHRWLRELTPSALVPQSQAFVPVTLDGSAPSPALHAEPDIRVEVQRANSACCRRPKTDPLEATVPIQN